MVHRRQHWILASGGMREKRSEGSFFPVVNTHACEHTCVSHLPSQSTLPAVQHHHKLHTFVALTQAGKLRAEHLVTTTRKMPHAKATQLSQCHQDRGTFLCTFTLAGPDMERREPGIQKDNPHFGTKHSLPCLQLGNFCWDQLSLRRVDSPSPR